MNKPWAGAPHERLRSITFHLDGGREVIPCATNPFPPVVKGQGVVEVACATNPFPPVVKGQGVVEVACATNPFPPLVKGGPGGWWSRVGTRMTQISCASLASVLRMHGPKSKTLAWQGVCERTKL